MSLGDVTKGSDASTRHSHGVVNNLSFPAFKTLKMSINENCCFSFFEDLCKFMCRLSSECRRLLLVPPSLH